jgi:hypothetical protein
VTTDLHITGKVAQFGRGIMGDVSSKLMAQFADNLNKMIDEQGDELIAEPIANPAAATAASDETPPVIAEVAQIRKIEGPATEPIDLMEIGSGSILKRVAPALIAIVVVVLLLRRRRG